MGVPALIGLAIGAQFMGMMSANAAVDDQIEAQNEQSRLEIEERDRQRTETGRQAQEQKSDRVREADQQFASMIVSLSEVGGGDHTAGRFAGETGLYEGLDLARIEGNRRRQVSALHSEQVASRNNALSFAKQGAAQKRSNFFNFLGGAANLGMKAFDEPKGGSTTKTDKPSPVPGPTTFQGLQYHRIGGR
ncbi:MAG: hypothetical protein GEU78_07865 [Actinobacteria bacterium]|nr:hypothetical protein [Actinomycetota bacterium]